MKLRIFLMGCLFCCTLGSVAQPPVSNYKIGVFAPLFLDSLFNSTGYKYGKEVPRFAQPGLDFVQGAQVALDSMNLPGNSIDAYFYDTKSYTQNISQLIRLRKLDSLNLLIGSVRDLEYKQLADFALAKNIPFISVTYPNDGNITANPFTVIMNSTLKAHCEGIYSYILQNHGADNIFLVRKKGAQEDKVAAYFRNINEPDGKPLINIQTIWADSSFSAVLLEKKLDSLKPTVVIGGSLDEAFAVSIANACNDLRENYPIKLIGMPNWDGFKAFFKKGNYPEFPLYFTSPYYNNKWDAHSKTLINAYNKKFKTRPSDMAFKGFEAALLFTRLLTRFPNDFMSHLNDKTNRVFCEYNFKPVTSKKEATIPDYFENKHLYFVRILDGSVSKAW